MLRAALLAATIALAAPSAAGAAQMTGTAADWAHSVKVHVPGPSGPPLTVTFGDCPGYTATPDMAVEGCLDGTTIYVVGTDPAKVEHELGHVFDRNDLSAVERAQLTPLLMHGRRPAWNDCGDRSDLDNYGACPFERFADAYAMCALAIVPDYRDRHGELHPSVDWNSDYDWAPSRATYKRVCRMIRAA